MFFVNFFIPIFCYLFEIWTSGILKSQEIFRRTDSVLFADKSPSFSLKIMLWVFLLSTHYIIILEKLACFDLVSGKSTFTNLFSE